MFYKPEHWMLTYSGMKIDPFNVPHYLICIADIAHALAYQCRYNGHCNKFYSVAEHSVLISQALERDGRGVDAAKWGLLHDASEAYLGDMVSPVKKQIDKKFKFAENRIEKAVAEVFGLSGKVPDTVHEYDTRIRKDEMESLFRFIYTPEEYMTRIAPLSVPITGWMPEEAENNFMIRYNELWPK